MDKVTIFQGISYALSGVFASVVILLGLIGNALSFVVLRQPQMRSPMSTFLSIQVVWDTLVLLGTIFLVTLPALFPYFRDHCYPYAIVYVYPVWMIARASSIWTIVGSTVMRYIVVCHPLKGKRMCTVPRARATLIFISGSALVFNIVRLLEFTIDDKNTSDESETVQITESDFIIQTSGSPPPPFMREVFYRYIYPIVMLHFPFLILAALNIRIYTAVKRSDKQRTLLAANQQNRPATRSNNATKMPLFVLVVIIICQLPTMVYNVAYSINTDINEELGWRVLSEVRIVLVTLNSAINVLIYCAMGRKFRHAFECTFTCNHDTRRWTRWTYHPVGSSLSLSARENSPLPIELREFRFEVPGQGQLNVEVECP